MASGGGLARGDLVHEGSELPHGPRNVLRGVRAALAERGLALKSGVECEFFVLGQTDPPSLSDALDTQAKPCYDAQALMRRYDLISSLCENMEALGWGPYQADHEDANGQFEINWDFDEVLTTADRVSFFKYMVRSLAEEQGLRATSCRSRSPTSPAAAATRTLAPRRVDGREPDGRRRPDGAHNLSPTALSFLAGVLQHAPAVAALTNPTVNSYQRLNASTTASGATWSPGACTWAGNNRTALVRVPDDKRIELRLADMAANPYLMAAAIGAAGLDGLARGASAPPPADLNMYDGAAPAGAAASAAAPQLPKMLPAALDNLDGSAALRAHLGDAFVDSYLKLRRAHWDEYAADLSPWEWRAYLDS